MNKKEKKSVETVLFNTDIKSNLEIHPDDKEMVELIEHYIETHKWLVSENVAFEVTIEQAIFSWYENVYRPLWASMKEAMVLSAFPKKRPVELFAAISDMHYYLSENSKDYVQYTEVCKRYILENSERPFFRLITKMSM